MSAFLIILLIATILVVTARTVRSDGYGHRPPPRSHAPWSAGELPSEPYRSLR